MKDTLHLKSFMVFKSQFFNEIEIYNNLWDSFRTFNSTALAYAAKNCYKDVVELLLQQGNIDINNQNILNQKHS